MTNTTPRAQSRKQGGRNPLRFAMKLTPRRPPAMFAALQRAETNHYATLGLDRRCTDEQIRAAYRVLAKQHHLDLNGNSPAAVKQTQALNAAYEILSDPARRRDHDRELDA